MYRYVHSRRLGDSSLTRTARGMALSCLLARFCSASADRRPALRFPPSGFNSRARHHARRGWASP